MIKRACTTIAAVVLKEPTVLGLDALADEILKSRIAQHAGSRSITWDCEDLVFLDFDGLRIGLYDVHETDDTPRTLCIAVGPVRSDRLPKHLDSTHIAQTLVKNLGTKISASAVLWHDVRQPLSDAVIEDFHHELDKMLGYLDMQMHGTRTPKEPSIPPVDETRTGRIKDEVALDVLRNKLRARGQFGGPVSLPLHVSLYILAVTFFFMIPALGSTLLSYIWLRDGVDKPKTSA